MKPFPIRVEKETDANYYDITWMLHNVCNHNCSFCDATFKDGSKRWLSLAENKQIVDSIISAANGKPIWFQFTGGEPTLYPDFIELCVYIKSRGAYIGLLSNGSRTIRWWTELRDSKLIENLVLTLHPEQGSTAEHHAEILNLFLYESVHTVCWITSTKDYIQESIDAHKYLVKTTGSEILLKVMNLPKYDITEFMTKRQAIYFKYFNVVKGKRISEKVSTTIPTEISIATNIVSLAMSDGTISKMSSQRAINNRYHLFKGWECYIGKYQAYVDVDRMHRGSCFFNTSSYIDLSSLPANFPSEPVTCGMDECLCGADIVALKVKNV